MTWKVDDRLVGINLLFERTARSQPSEKLHALEVMRLMHDGAVMGGGPAGLPADQAALIDCMSEADDQERNLAKCIYWDHSSVAQKAGRLGITRTKFYEQMGELLAYFLGAMRSKGFSL